MQKQPEGDEADIEIEVFIRRFRRTYSRCPALIPLIEQMLEYIGDRGEFNDALLDEAMNVLDFCQNNFKFADLLLSMVRVAKACAAQSDEQ